MTSHALGGVAGSKRSHGRHLKTMTSYQKIRQRQSIVNYFKNDQAFSWNNLMAIILSVGLITIASYHIIARSVDAYLLREQSCQISPRSDFKRRSLGLFWTRRTTQWVAIVAICPNRKWSPVLLLLLLLVYCTSTSYTCRPISMFCYFFFIYSFCTSILLYIWLQVCLTNSVMCNELSSWSKVPNTAKQSHRCNTKYWHAHTLHQINWNWNV